MILSLLACTWISDAEHQLRTQDSGRPGGPGGGDSGVVQQDDTGSGDDSGCVPEDETCNEEDDDCDGAVDEEAVDAPGWYVDADGDGFGTGDAPAMTACAEQPDMASAGGDCDDDDDRVNPDARELCHDQVDNDCDDVVDACTPYEVGYDALDSLVSSDVDSQAGGALGAGGDIDESGHADLAVGAYGYSNDSRQGAAGVVLDGSRHDSFSSSDLTLVVGSVAGDVAGISVALGHHYGEQYAELVVGVPYATDTDGGELGQARIFSGDTTAWNEPGQLAMDKAASTLYALAQGDGFGSVIAFLGEETPGGGELLAVGSAELGLDNLGGACIFEPSESASRTIDDARACWFGTGFDYMGWDLAGRMDLEGDGTPLMAMSAIFGENDAGDVTGKVLIVDPTLEGVFERENDAVQILSGTQPDEEAGTALASGDFDHDGYDDLVIGASYADSEFGRVYIVPGPVAELPGELDDPMALLEGTQAGERFGSAVAGGEDVDGDGYDDLVVGGPWRDDYAGAAYFFLGPISGTWSGDDATGIVTGPDHSAQLGASLAMGFDFDQDDQSDVAIGAPGFEFASQERGAVFLLQSSKIANKR